MKTAINQVISKCTTTKVFNFLFLFVQSFSFLWVLLLSVPFCSVTGKLNYSCSFPFFPFSYFVKCFVHRKWKAWSEGEAGWTKWNFIPFCCFWKQKVNGKWAMLCHFHPSLHPNVSSRNVKIFYQNEAPMDHFTLSTPYCSHSLNNKRLAEASMWNGKERRRRKERRKMFFPWVAFSNPGLSFETQEEKTGEEKNVSENKFLVFWHFSYFRFYTFSNFMLQFTHNKIKLKIMGIKINAMDTFFQSEVSILLLLSGNIALNVFWMCWNLSFRLTLELNVSMQDWTNASIEVCR